MIDIGKLRLYYQQDNVLMTQHSSERCRQRNIRKRDIRHAVMTGEIIEQYPDDFPFPSCLILGYTDEEKPIHVVMSDEGSGSRIITAYFPDVGHWDSEFKFRKEEKI
ncbi:MAG: DUF4258 domain-containing protein [Lachnospiraceae bacterium]|nr:DUF4258 domain-containing protein [Lachnospiraceae bacterium]